MKEIVKIFDTTLRDGEQSPGASMTPDEKLKLALQLEKLNVDIIEAGFPYSSKSDFESVRLIAENIKRPEVCGLCRAKDDDIKAAWDAIQNASNPRLHTFIATSDIHLKYKLKMTREDALDKAIKAVRYAKTFTDNVEFSCEDATRSDFSYLCKVLEKVIDAGAVVVNIPDTVGYAQTEEFSNLIGRIRSVVPNISTATISVHCHNDLGLACANSLSAVKSGARQIECTINGLGERAGNAALEEVVMNLKTRKDCFKADTGIKTEEIYNTSLLASRLTGIAVQFNKAIVGRNAFLHEAGIHQHGIISNRETYEIIDPKTVGRETSLLLGKHSGRHALEERIKALGYNLDKGDIDIAFKEFKELCDSSKSVSDKDIIKIASNILKGKREG